MAVRIGLAVGALLTLSACLGGSGVGTSSFTSVSDIDSNGTTVISGRAVDAPFTGNVFGGSTSLGTSAPESVAELRIKVENDEVVGIRLAVDGRTIVDADSADDVNVESGVIAAGESGNVVILRDPEEVGFEYQTFGIWIEGNDFTSSSGRVGNVTAGSVTPAGNIPSITRATYRGESVGWAVLPTGEFGLTEADVTLTTSDFVTVDFATENTAFGEYGLTTIVVGASDLNLTGTLTVNGSSFSGSVSGAITDGTLNGRFYGPNAEEAGGLFVTTGSGGTAYNGSFGARR